MDRKKTTPRLWAVLFWLAVWQLAAMAMAGNYRGPARSIGRRT